MPGLGQLKEELEGLADELESVCQVPEAVRQPEVARARALIDQARSALASAFLSRRALILARQAVATAEVAVSDAVDVSRVLRDRSQVLRAQAAEIREATAEARDFSATLIEWSRRDGSADEPPGEVVLDSAIPAEHPEKRAIEAAVTDVLVRGGGRWHVWITVPSIARWWGLRVRGPAIDWVATLQDAREQTAAAITSRLVPLAQIALAEAQYRRTLRPSRGRPERAKPGGSEPRG